MGDLLVLAFKEPNGAAEFAGEVKRMQTMNILKLEDAAIVTRDAGGKAKVKQANSLVGAGAFGGAFWGMLIGLLFWMPWLGLAVGAISGALAGKFSDIGIDDKFIKQVGEEIPPSSSALFLMVQEATPDRVLDEVRGHDIKIIQTSLSKDAEERLREAFATPTRTESLDKAS